MDDFQQDEETTKLISILNYDAKLLALDLLKTINHFNMINDITFNEALAEFEETAEVITGYQQTFANINYRDKLIFTNEKVIQKMSEQVEEIKEMNEKMCLDHKYVLKEIVKFSVLKKKEAEVESLTKKISYYEAIQEDWTNEASECDRDIYQRELTYLDAFKTSTNIRWNLRTPPSMCMGYILNPITFNMKSFCIDKSDNTKEKLWDLVYKYGRMSDWKLTPKEYKVKNSNI